MGERKYTFLKFFAYVIEIIIFYILEGVPNLFPEVLQGKPLFLLPIALSIGFFEKEIPAMVYGIVCGSLIDFGVASHFGFYTFSLAILCFFIGYIVENFFNLSLVFFLIVSVIAVPVLISLNFVFTYIVLGYSDYITYYVNHIVPIMIYTFIVSPIFYGINKVIHNKFGVVK